MAQEPDNTFPLPVPITGCRRWRPLLLLFCPFVLFLVPVLLLELPVPAMVGRAALALVVVVLVYDWIDRVVRSRSSRGRERRALRQQITSELGHAEWSGTVEGLDRKSLDDFTDALTAAAPSPVDRVSS